MATEAVNNLPMGSPAPDFALPDVVTGKSVSLQELKPFRALLVIFLCRHCPYVVHVREEILRIAGEYRERGLATVSISSNDAATYPDDAPDKLREMAVQCGFSFPLLYDASQETARAYDALCTPDFFLFDADSRLAYRGRLDESTPRNGRPVTGADLRAAVEAVLGGSPVPEPQRPSLGCSIKWK
jgi:peroxiredoxin